MELKTYSIRELANKEWLTYNAIRDRILKHDQYVKITFIVWPKRQVEHIRYLDDLDSKTIKQAFTR